MRPTYLLVCLFFPYALSIPVTQVGDPELSDDEHPDTTFSGLYKIENCGANHFARLNPEASQVKAFLPLAWQKIQYLLADVKLGTASKYGYAALFETNDSVATVSKTFQDIANGPSIPLNNYNPTLVCLHTKEKFSVFQGLYDKGCAGGTRAAISFPKYAHIALCPAWFEAGKHGLNLPVHVDCPTLRANNTLEDAKYPLLRNQYAVFLEEMLQLYLEGGNFEAEHSEDVYPTHEYVGLNATASLRNVQNWAIYAASVQASCEDWPKMPSLNSTPANGTKENEFRR